MNEAIATVPQDTRLVNLTEARIADFHTRVDKRGPDECWPWMRGKGTHGYGAFPLHGKMIKAHRMAFYLAYGWLPAWQRPEALSVCHKCDNPVCCNPAHLFVASHVENVADRVRKGRTASGDRNGSRTRPDRRAFGKRSGAYTHPESVSRGAAHSATMLEHAARGESHYLAKLTADQVRQIRQLRRQGMAYQRIADMFGVSFSAVYRIIKGRSWKHIQ